MSDAGLRSQILGAIDNRDLHRLYDYWAARCRDGRLPGRRDIDPLEFPFVLGNVILVDVLRDPLRFRYRLTGTNLVERFRLQLTGKMVDEHPDPEFRRIALAVYTQVAVSGRPYSVKRDSVIDGRVRHYDSLALPLAGDGVTVDMIMVATKFVA